MEKENSGFRNNVSKCWHNDVGYCKFKEECWKAHSLTICEKETCDKKCSSRHPRECKYKERCKFQKKDICAFSHVYVDDSEESLKQRFKDMEKAFETNKAESESKIERLIQEIKKSKERV